LGACDFLELFLEDVRIKWPNDLYAGNRKIGGILIETAVKGSWIVHAILGLGININQETFPPQLPNPVSLGNLTGIRYDLRELEDLLITACLKRFAGLTGDQPELIGKMPEPGSFRPEYLKKLFRYKEFAPYQVHGMWLNARIIDVEELGHLVIEDESGNISSHAYPEIEFLL
jgi:BirA family biotin operon repressor/biotin-[acetyl-CoA-carboxylase] ligase